MKMENNKILNHCVLDHLSGQRHEKKIKIA